MSFCEKCIIPDSFPGVTLENGLCNFCRNYEASAGRQNNRDRSQTLANLLRKGRKNRPTVYDCLVPVSGDCKSCYALYHITRNLKLRPFAVFFDSGFTTMSARQNVEIVCRKLGVPWTVVRSRSRHRRKAVIEALILSRITGRYISLCKNCENNLRAVAVNEAARRKIPYILWSSTELHGPVNNHNIPQALLETTGADTGNASTGLNRLAREANVMLLKGGLYHLLKYYCRVVLDNLALKSPGGFRCFNPFYQVPLTRGNIRVVHFYRYTRHDPVAQETLLKTELGWQPPDWKGEHLNCRLRCVENYASVRATGLSLNGIDNAALVRQGLMHRTEALLRETALRKTLEKDCLQTLKFLGFENYPLELLPGWYGQNAGVASRFDH